MLLSSAALAPYAAADDAKDAGAGAGDAGAKPPPPKDAPKATIVVPASAVTRALEKRDVGAVNAVAPDGTALGCRLIGVSKYKTGLRDGDIVVSVGNAKTPNVSAMVTIGMMAGATGATQLTGRIVRAGVTYAVVVELPK
jgi:hypothetical protein